MSTENSLNRCSRSHVWQDWQWALDDVENYISKTGSLIWCMGVKHVSCNQAERINIGKDFFYFFNLALWERKGRKYCQQTPESVD